MTVIDRFIARTTKRSPDFVIGGVSANGNDQAYLKRWWVIPRNKFFNIYLHHFRRSDDDRALHDHPWLFNISVLLRGSYIEHTPAGQKKLEQGAYRFRWGAAPHRVELFPALGVENAGKELPVWTLFITGPKYREWGFYCPKGWKHWKDFTTPGKPGEIGPGCGD